MTFRLFITEEILERYCKASRLDIVDTGEYQGNDLIVKVGLNGVRNIGEEYLMTHVKKVLNKT